MYNFVQKIVAFGTILFFLASSTLNAEQLVTLEKFKGLQTSPVADKISDGGHTKFTNVYIKDNNLNPVKGRDRLNAAAHADAVVNGMWYYESSTGTKKVVVKESDEIVSYDIDGTGRTSLLGSLTNEVATAVQVGNNLYITSTTDGLIKWSGSGSAAAISGVSAPSAVDFSASTTAGGLTPGDDAIVVPLLAAGSGYRWEGSTCVAYNYVQLKHIYECYQLSCSSSSGADSNSAGVCFSTSGGSTTYYTKSCATSSTYQYKLTKYSSKWGIESEASTVDTADLIGNNTVTKVNNKFEQLYSNNTCTSPATIPVEASVLYTGAQTSTTGTLAAAPTDPFDGYCIYRTVASGSDFFKLGCTTTVGAAYTDGKPDAVLGDPFDSTIDTITPPSFKYIESYKGSLFLAEGNTIYFTRLPVDATTNADTYWLETDKITLSSKDVITGLRRVKNALLIFTTDSVFKLSGYGVSTFRLETLVTGIGAVSQESVELDSNGDVIFFAGTQGVYKIQVGNQLSDDLTGTQINRSNDIIKKISSPDLDDNFRGLSLGGVALDVTKYTASHSYYDADNNLYFLYIGTDCLMFDSTEATWSYIPATYTLASAWRKSANSVGVGVLVDNLGFFYNNWTGYDNGIHTGTVTGTSTASGNTTLTDSTATFNTTSDGLKGLWVFVPSTGEWRQIASNTATQLTITAAWTSNPTNGSTYYVGYIVMDWLTKQYSIAKIPNDTIVQAFTLTHNKAATSQLLYASLYREKQSTIEETATVDLSLNNIDKIGQIAGRSPWIQVGFKSYVYNTSNTVVPPVDISAYTFHATAREKE